MGQQQMSLLANKCNDCDVDLDHWGRNRVTTPISQRVIEVCDRCAKDWKVGLKGEILTDDGTVYAYFYLPHNQVTCFYPLAESEDDSDDSAEYDPDAEEFSGSYSPKYGPYFVTGTTPYPHLEELCEKWVKLCPDAQERARKLKEVNT